MVQHSYLLRLVLAAVCLLLSVRSGYAQDESAIIHLTPADVEAAAGEAAKTQGDPLTAIFLEQRQDHAAILVVRTESGEAEAHEVFDDIYMVREGTAVLVYGGTYEGARTTGPGELRGGEIRDGQRQTLTPGDVVVVPAEVPHQVTVAEGGRFVYHVLKVRRGK